MALGTVNIKQPIFKSVVLLPKFFIFKKLWKSVTQAGDASRFALDHQDEGGSALGAGWQTVPGVGRLVAL